MGLVISCLVFGWLIGCKFVWCFVGCRVDLYMSCWVIAAVKVTLH